MARERRDQPNANRSVQAEGSWSGGIGIDEAQLLAVTAQGRYILTVRVRGFVVLARTYPQQGGIAWAAQASWTLSELVKVLDRLLSETEAEERAGRVRWLNNGRQQAQVVCWLAVPARGLVRGRAASRPQAENTGTRMEASGRTRWPPAL